MIVAISYATAIESNQRINTEKKESPLYLIRTRRAITEKIAAVIENIRTKFLGERMFFLPFQWFSRIIKDKNLVISAVWSTACDTCFEKLCDK